MFGWFCFCCTQDWFSFVCLFLCSQDRLCLFLCSQDWLCLVGFVLLQSGLVVFGWFCFSAVRTGCVWFVCFSAVRTGCVWLVLFFCSQDWLCLVCLFFCSQDWLCLVCLFFCSQDWMCLVCLFFCSQDWLLLFFCGVFSAVRTSRVCFVVVFCSQDWLCLVSVDSAGLVEQTTRWCMRFSMARTCGASRCKGSFIFCDACCGLPHPPPLFFSCVFVVVVFCSQDWLSLVSVDRAGLVKLTNWRCLRFSAG